MILGLFREMFDLMTFYSPVSAVVSDPKPVAVSLSALFWVYTIFVAISVFAEVISMFVFGNEFMIQNISVIVGSFIFLLLWVPFSSGIVFVVSRLFSGKGSLEGFVSLNYFVAASSSLFMMFYFLPLSGFAGVFLFVLGAVFFLYFSDAVITKFFGVSSVGSIALLIIYVAFLPALAFGVLSGLPGNFLS
jgi:hypothetical protein